MMVEVVRRHMSGPFPNAVNTRLAARRGQAGVIKAAATPLSVSVGLLHSGSFAIIYNILDSKYESAEALAYVVNALELAQRVLGASDEVSTKVRRLRAGCY